MEINNTVDQGSFSLFVWVYPRDSLTTQGILKFGGPGSLPDAGLALDIGTIFVYFLKV